MTQYLGRVGVHHAQILLPVGALQHEFLAVGAHHLVRMHVHAHKDQVQELLHVPQQLLGDALARRVDAALDPRRTKQERGGK